MLIDDYIGFDSGDIGSVAQLAESAGYSGVWASEVTHDPLLILASAATATSRISLGTGILVAFGRSPMITATMANDVQLLSEGRLLLGLGSQIKPHIEKRYSMPWSRPAARMREYVLALRAIWSCWNDDEPLRFQGEFYRHTLMTPFFNPGPNPFGVPKIFVSAVGELMTEVAGEVADGLLAHPFTTQRYLREVTMPALERGFAKSGRTRDQFQIALSGLVTTGLTSDEELVAQKAVRKQIAFYGSTPAYRGVLDRHGWGDLQSQLNGLTKSGEWDAMGQLIDDDVLHEFSVVGAPNEIPALIGERFGGLVDRFSLYTPYDLDPGSRSGMVSRLLVM
jgi:probable F420-dependent oxidoreductase